MKDTRPPGELFARPHSTEDMEEDVKHGEGVHVAAHAFLAKIADALELGETQGILFDRGVQPIKAHEVNGMVLDGYPSSDFGYLIGAAACSLSMSFMDHFAKVQVDEMTGLCVVDTVALRSFISTAMALAIDMDAKRRNGDLSDWFTMVSKAKETNPLSGWQVADEE